MSKRASHISQKLQDQIDMHTKQLEATKPKPVKITNRHPPPSNPAPALPVTDPANSELLKQIIRHLEDERASVEEQNMQLEVDRFRDNNSEKALQRQLQMLQFQIQEHHIKLEQQAQLDQMHEQQHKRRREKLQRMIEDLQTELETELLAETQYQAFKRRQHEENIEMQKRLEKDITSVRTRLERSAKPREKDREELEQKNSQRLVKIQTLYQATVEHQNKPTALLAPKRDLKRVSLPPGKLSKPPPTPLPVAPTPSSLKVESAPVIQVQEEPKELFDEDSPLARACEFALPAISLYGSVALEN